MDSKIRAMRVISHTNFKNFLGGYLTAREIEDNCTFLVPQIFATSPQKELIKADDTTKVIQRDN